jgi:hypothetical protein
LAEGSNLYYTQARFDSALAAKSTTDLAEGTNQYFTSARAKSAAVVNSSVGSETDQAMSVSAAKSYIDAADNARLKLDGTNSMTGVLNFTGATGRNITWGSDGGGNIGASGANRPNNVYVKDSVYIGGFMNIGVNMSWVSDGSGDIGNPTNFRPNNVYAKTSVTSSGKAVFTQSNAAAPGYCFGGATNFGMYYDTNTVGLAASGQAALTCTVASVSAAKPLVMMQGYSVHRTAVSTNTSISTTQGLIAVTDTSAARTLTVPSAAAVSWKHYIIKDESGGASATRYIRVQPGTAGQTLDGAAYYDIKVPYEALIVYSNGQNWFIV